jgi:hypothetical protein
MRKIMLAVVATCVVGAVIPAGALAQGHKHHRAHHARTHHRTFGHDWNQSGSTSTGTTSSEPPAGTVQTFTGGVLTIALTGSGTVSGMVTPDTEIECQVAEPAGMQSHDRNQGDNSGPGDDDQGQGDDDQGQGDDDQGQGDDDQGQGDQQANQMCDPTTVLTRGAVVQEAVLTVSGAGAVFQKIELVTQPSSTSTSTSSHHHD